MLQSYVIILKVFEGLDSRATTVALATALHTISASLICKIDQSKSEIRVRRCAIGRNRFLCKDISVRFVHQTSHKYV